MTRRPRVPGTSKRGVLYVLPSISDDYPDELKNAIAIRNACTVEGRCPGCGAPGEIHEDEQYAGIFHLTFRHEPWCGALTDEAA